ncbi:4'-phosphopantetheinyl transferase superfamily protein [Streptomyces sp. NPDC004787]|uniref:4'-phosphopantetheinyl transferase family protein n=1 Tax=Streptomyces sp. NPDC004787 TaxID=3154291 RepID=UPI0033A277AF
MRSLLPPGVAVVEAYKDTPGTFVHPAEAGALARAVDKRRLEYTTVRHCARQALAELGLPPAPVLSGAHGEPLWPDGILGSMTHCDGYRAAALTHKGSLASLGIDGEPHEPLPQGVLEAVARPEEHRYLAEWSREHPGICWDRVLFSAKESVYKAWFPLARRWLGFEDAVVRFAPQEGTFTAALHVPGPVIGGAPVTAVCGRWKVRDGLILTSASVPAA